MNETIALVYQRVTHCDRLQNMDNTSAADATSVSLLDTTDFARLQGLPSRLLLDDMAAAEHVEVVLAKALKVCETSLTHGLQSQCE